MVNIYAGMSFDRGEVEQLLFARVPLFCIRTSGYRSMVGEREFVIIFSCWSVEDTRKASLGWQFAGVGIIERRGSLNKNGRFLCCYGGP